MADERRSQQLDRIEEQVAQRVREAVEALRDTVRERMRSTQDRLLSELGDLVPELPSRLVPPESLEPLAAEAGSAEVRRNQGALVAAFAAVDRARGQSEVLAALAREAGRFAARTAVLLARPERAEVWTAHGWPGDLAGAGVDYPGEEGAWSPARFGRGALALDAAGCAALAAAAGAPAAEVGVLVPLVLRDRLAAVLYADAGEADAGDDRATLQPAALQVLAYTAALALETLPFRQRAATSTLLAEGDGEALGLGAAGAAGGGGHGTAMGLAAAGVAAAGLAAAGLAAARRRGRHDEEEAGTAPEDGTAAQAEAAVASLETTGAVRDPGPEVAAPPVPGAPGALAGEEPPGERAAGDVVAAEDTGFELEGVESGLQPSPWEATGAESAAPPSTPEEAAREVSTPPAPVPEEPVREESAPWTLEDADETAGGGPRAAVGELEVSEPLAPELEAPDFEAPELEAPDLDTPELEAPDLQAPEPGEDTAVDLDRERAAGHTGTGGGGEAGEPAGAVIEPALPGQPPIPREGTVDGFEAAPPAAEGGPGTGPWTGTGTGTPEAAAHAAEPTHLPPAAPPATPGYAEGDDTQPGAQQAAASPPAATPAVGGGDSQVRPPQDLEGPGSAFRAREAKGSGDAQHEEARRLARLLVSEIRLYNEEEVEAGRRNRDVYDRLKEDIDRSRQVYEDQVKPEIRESTDYFYEELVRNLGGGDASTLGI